MANRQPGREVIGLLPCGGRATRIAPLPLSKEIYPVGFRQGVDGLPRPKVVCHYLLEQLRRAGVTKAYLVLRSGKWDIPAYFGDGDLVDMRLAYLIMNLPHGVPFTLDQAYPLVREATIATGFPDILLQPENVFTTLLERLDRETAEVVLALFPSDQCQKVSMVKFEESGRVVEIIDKPQESDLAYMWGAAVWTPRFTQFMHDYVQADQRQRQASPIDSPIRQREMFMSEVIQAGIDRALPVDAEVFATGSYLDIGTPDDLLKAVQEGSWVVDG